jgi:hypothetical protein
MRDMLLSMVVLAVIVLVLGAVTHSCSFSPGGPSVNESNLPTVDVSGELSAAAGQVHFPLRRPALPGSWRANSDSERPVGTNGAQAVVYVGWLTGTGHFLQLAQSDASVSDLVTQVADDSGNATGGSSDGSSGPATAQGHVTVAGAVWTIYSGVRDEQSWVRDLGPVRLLITGNAPTGEFDTMAASVQTAPVVRTGS